jgi:hypothetical protein
MNKDGSRAALAIALALGGCASSPPETRGAPLPVPPQVAMVQLMKMDPPPQCGEVGTDYEMIVWGNVEGARRKLRENAAARGGNYVRLEMPAGGTIYRCPSGSSAPPGAPPATGAPLAGAPPQQREAVRLMKGDPPQGCAEMGSVSEPIWLGDVEGARTRLKQKAVAMGANYVRLELPTVGTAFRCP